MSHFPSHSPWRTCLLSVCLCGAAFGEKPAPPDPAALERFSKQEEVALLTFTHQAAPDYLLTNVVFGIRGRQLVIARREAHCGNGVFTKDATAYADALVDDTRNLPWPVEYTVNGERYEIRGLSFTQLPDGRTVIASLAGRRMRDSYAFEWDHLTDGTLDGPGGGGGGPRGFICLLGITGICNDTFCEGSGNCVIDALNCDPCDCSSSGFCTDGTAVFTCIDNGCADAGGVCAMIPECECVCRRAARPLRLRTGPNSAVDGYCDIAPDEYGSWAQPFTGGEGPNDDHFNPAGSTTGGTPHPLRQVCFTNGFFLFAGPIERELLSDNADWQGVSSAGQPFGADPTLERIITSENVAFDTNGDGADDMATSAFRVFSPAGTTNLDFQLVQRIRTAGPGVAVFEQQYMVTNLSAAPISFALVRAVDGDLIYTETNFANDEVGTTCNAAGIGRFAFQRDRDAGEAYDSTGLVVHGGPDGRFYYGGKQNHTPPNGPPIMGFGTDVQIWEARGVPQSWQNYIATVGYNVDGVNGVVTGTQDTFMGLDFTLNLLPGQMQPVAISQTYGQITPARPPCPGDITGDGQVDLTDLAQLLANFGGGGPNLPGDLDGDSDVDIGDLALLLANFGNVC